MGFTAQNMIDRIKRQLPNWKDPSVDTFLAGKPDTEVKGIVTTFAPSLEVMHKAVASGKNFIISRETPFWARNTAPGATGRGGGGGGRGPAPVDNNDPTARAKREYIAANNLVVYRFFDNWNARQPDPQLQALSKALGWEKSSKLPDGTLTFTIPPATLKETAQTIKKTLKLKSIRGGGDPNVRVSKAVLANGVCAFPEMQKLLAEPGVDLIVMGAPDWEIYDGQYAFDFAAAGIKKGSIMIGHQASDEPGCGEMAAWLKQFTTEVPIEWIPAGEPTWMPY
jgi:putative NIF3 family GTP cyclohydrolase 1 type 2